MSNIKNIEIRNFKSIRHAKIEDCRRVNVFVGYPNVGKSNILEAMSLFSFRHDNMNFRSNIRIEELTTIFFNGNIENNIEIKVNDTKRWVGKMLKDFIRFEEQYVKQRDMFDDALPLLLREDGNSGLFAVGSFFDLKETKIKEIFDGVRVENSHFPRSMEVKFHQMINELKKYVFKRDISHSSDKFDSLDSPFGNNLFAILSAHQSIKKQVDELFYQYDLELLYDARLQRLTILKRTKSGIFSIPYELVADTLQRLIFYKTATLSNNDCILLFEEPEAHMFPPYISKLTTDVMYDQSNNQFFISTHSPFVLNDFMEDMAKEELSIYAVGYLNGETTINRLTDKQVTDIYQYGVDLFFNLEDFLKDVVS